MASEMIQPDVVMTEAILLRRYKRFLADLRLANGEEITVHCPNTGSMKNCVVPESPCWYSTSNNAKRKYPHTLEVVTVPGGFIAGINTGRANGLVQNAVLDGTIKELQGYSLIRREVVYGGEKSRVDFLLSGAAGDSRDCYVEVKSVTLMEEPGQGLFPDAVSQRGSKHLRELMAMVRDGHRAVLLYCVQHTGIEWVEPASLIDPIYSKTLREAVDAGVEVYAYRALIEPERGRLLLNAPLPVRVHQ